MGKKLDPGRFTIRLDLQDPEARWISELLNSLGRKKGQYIVRAILCYVGASHDVAGAPGYPVRAELPLAPESEPQRGKPPLVHAVVPNKPPAKAPTAPQSTAMSPEAERALQSALAAFDI